MKKIIVGMFTAGIMCMLMMNFVFADSVSCDGLLERLDAQFQGQEKASDAFQNLMEHIEDEDEWGYIYPDEYGGSYISEDNRLVIELTELTKENIEKYKGYCGGDEEVLQFVPVDFSYNELQEYANEISRQGITGVTEVGVAEDKNSVLLGIDGNSKDMVLKEISGSKSMVKRAQKKADIPVIIECNGNAETVTDDVGGMGLSSGALVGACAAYNDKYAFKNQWPWLCLIKCDKNIGYEGKICSQISICN